MIDPERLEEIVREELSSQRNTDEDARDEARERIQKDEEVDALYRHARDRRGYY